MPVLEPIKIQSTEVAEDGSSKSEPEDKGNFEVAYDSDDDSEPEADRHIKKVGDEGGGKRVMSETKLIIVSNYKGYMQTTWPNLEAPSSSQPF